MKNNVVFRVICLGMLAAVLMLSLSVPAGAAGLRPGSDDLDNIRADIKYPREESFYLDQYLYGTVAKNNAVAFINPNASDVMADKNTFLVRKGEAVKAIAQSSGVMCVIFPDLYRAGWISRSDLDLDISFAVRPGARPGAADLDAVQADAVYPRSESMYLNNYIVTTVRYGTGLVYLNPNAGDVTADRNCFDVKKGDPAIVLAESGGLACCIFPDLGRAGWIGCEFLTNS